MTLPFYPLEFDSAGLNAVPAQLDLLINESRRIGLTDLIVLAHGFRCDANEATALYTSLIENVSPQLAGIFAVTGVYWPSKKYRESARIEADRLRGRDCAVHDRKAQDDYVASVLSAFDDGRNDPTEGLHLLHEIPGSELLEIVGQALPHVEHASDVLERRIDTFLNFMTWSAMKNLSGEVGASGLAASMRKFQAELSGVKIHLVGHSLGGRLVAACCKALGRQGLHKIASLSLLEAAFSHFGFSHDAGSGQPGFFREVIDRQVVRGPVISTFSKQDTVVGNAYALASRLARDRLQAVGDSCDPYGGIGHNGAQRTAESISMPLQLAGAGKPYRFRSGIVTCLDGSAGMIKNHGDVTNRHVAQAVASAITQAP